MSENNKLTLIKDQFENDQTGETVEGITVIVDGKIKEIFDLIMAKSEQYEDYQVILKEALFVGVGEIIKSIK